jgi:hypothetical protein
MRGSKQNGGSWTMTGSWRRTKIYIACIGQTPGPKPKSNSEWKTRPHKDHNGHHMLILPILYH